MMRTLATTGLLASLLLLIAGSAPRSAEAQTNVDSSYTITVEERTDEHPWTGRENAFSDVFAVDSTQGDTLVLERDSTYQFVMNEVPDEHPFYISESEVGQGGEAYTDGISSTNPDHDDQAWGTDTLSFTPNSSTPDTLYYQCVNHRYMGGTLVITDETATAAPDDQVASELPQQFQIRGNYPNPFNPSTRIQFALPGDARVQIHVFDALGQHVETAQAGRVSASTRATVRLNLSGQPSGLYLYRIVAQSADRRWIGTGQMTLVQ